MKLVASLFTVCIISSVYGNLLRAEPNVAHSNDFSGQLEQVRVYGSPTDTLMSNQYFVSKKHIPSPELAKGQCDAFKCIEEIIGFFRTSKTFSAANCKPSNGHLQHYVDMDKDKEDASVCREIYLLGSCDTPDIHPTGVQCVRRGGSESTDVSTLGCKCRLFGRASNNKKLVGSSSTGKEVLLPFEIKKDGTVNNLGNQVQSRIRNPGGNAGGNARGSTGGSTGGSAGGNQLEQMRRNLEARDRQIEALRNELAACRNSRTN
jgi:hypothetical protein